MPPPPNVRAGHPPMWRRTLITALHIAVLGGVGAIWIAAAPRIADPFGPGGLRFALATHLLDGHVPYRTLLADLPPGAYAIDALLLAIRGRTMASQHLAAAVESFVVYPLATYLVARSLLRRSWLALAAGLGVMLLTPGVPGIRLLPVLIALVLAARWLSGGQTRALAASGVVAGIATSFSVGAAGAAAAAVVLAVVVRTVASRRTLTGLVRVPMLPALTAFGIGLLAGSVPFLGLLAVEGSAGTFLAYVSKGISQMSGQADPAAGPMVLSARVWMPMACLPAVMCVAARVARLPEARSGALVAAMVAASSVLRLAPAAGDPSDARLLMALADLPLLACLLADQVLDARGRLRLPSPDMTLAIAGGVLVSALWALDPSQGLYAAGACLAAVAVAWPRLAPRGLRRVPSRAGVRLGVPVIALTLLAAAPSIATARLQAPADAVELSGVLWPADQAALVREAAAAAGDVAPGARIAFMYPDMGVLYELSGRRNATSFPVVPDDPAGWEIERLRTELESSPPDVVIVRYTEAGRRSRELSGITQLLEQRYFEVRRFDRPEIWGVWVAQDPPEACTRMMLHALSDPAMTLGRDLDIGRDVGGREEPVIAQHAWEIRLPVRLERGSYVRFTILAESADPRAPRSMHLQTPEEVLPIWEGDADGTPRRLLLPPQEVSGDLVLRSPAGRTTLWSEVTVCRPSR